MAGVDGCRGGWLVATTGLTRRSATTVAVVARFADVIAAVDDGSLVAVGVDMPIGLPSDGSPRACDQRARARLGPRRSSLFPTPPRATLAHAASYADAAVACRAITGKGLSKQAFHLLAKMTEVDDALTPAHERTVFECHPESCFVTLAGRPLQTVKRSPAGAAERRSLLRPHFPAVDDLAGRAPRGAAADDVLDALAMAWTARRWVRGTATPLGDGARDERGLLMRIVV